MLRELQEEISQKDTTQKRFEEAISQRDVYITQVHLYDKVVGSNHRFMNLLHGIFI